MKNRGVILVIDDEESMRDSCVQILVRDGYQAETAENGQKGLDKIRELKPDLVLVDLKMPGISGFDVLEHLGKIDPGIIAVVITGYATVESAVEAMKKGAYDFLPKPFTPEELRIIISRGLERRRLALEADALRREKKLMEEHFITMVSHQLRSPLVAIQQYFEVILAGLVGKVDNEQKEMILRARERLQGLLKLINDWLDLARIDKGRIVASVKPVPLKPLLQKILDFMKPLAQADSIAMELRPESESLVALGDEDMLEQAFSNLISNAIKYNRHGGSVSVGLRKENGFAAIEIKDTGIGIAKDHLPLIFDQFFRADASKGKKTEGTGLGLSIAKKIVDAHDGAIEATSTQGEGSTFTVRLPRVVEEKS